MLTMNIKPMWIANGGNIDVYAAFRGWFELLEVTRVSVDILGAHWFNAWIDGRPLTSGPYRFPPDHPEYETLELTLDRGRHVIAGEVRSEGISTRMLQSDVIPPFFACDVSGEAGTVPIVWKTTRLRGHVRSGQRISAQFAWIEWVDSRLDPEEWQLPCFDDSAWDAPVEVELPGAKYLRRVSIGPVQSFNMTPRQIDGGFLTGPFDGAEPPDWPGESDPSWYKRNLHPASTPTGVWRRYDLGRVRLGRARFTLDLPAGSVLEFAYSEALQKGPVTDGWTHEAAAEFSEPEATRDPRLAPYIPLSYPPSRNLDHFIARGGPQTFMPVIPKGGRYIEVQIQGEPSKCRFLEEEYVERSYYGPPAGRFECDDALLNDIWMLGVETLRGCAEDAIIDNPTRERGQWGGDVMVSMEIAAAAYHDVSVFKRGIQQAAYCARGDGLVAGLNPGGLLFMSTYAAMWVTSVIRYYDLTGDAGLLEELYPYAVRNLAVFEKHLRSDGIEIFDAKLIDCFIDWGCIDSAKSMALTMHTLEAFRGMERWSGILGIDPAPYRRLASRLGETARDWAVRKGETENWEEAGYHCAVLALHNDLLPEAMRDSAFAYIKSHILRCFPNNPEAPRLVGPEVKDSRIITPYFTGTYAFPLLVENGDMEFVLDQCRTCWGWALGQGLTTMPEVFDLHWSHCHVWASHPTALLSKYVLGLSPRFGEGQNHFTLQLAVGGLGKAAGRVPLTNSSGEVEITWERKSLDQITYRLKTPAEISLRFGPGASMKRLVLRNEATLQFERREGRWWLTSQ